MELKDLKEYLAILLDLEGNLKLQKDAADKLDSEIWSLATQKQNSGPILLGNDNYDNSRLETEREERIREVKKQTKGIVLGFFICLLFTVADGLGFAYANDASRDGLSIILGLILIIMIVVDIVLLYQMLKALIKGAKKRKDIKKWQI